MKIIGLSNKGMYDLRLLGCESLDEYRSIVEWVFKQRWKTESSINELLTEEERSKLAKAEQTFDYLKDYDAYWCDFFSIGIDLERDEIDFFRFCWMLDNKFMTDETSAISKRMRMRTYKPQKGDSVDHKHRMSNMKSKYSLLSIDDQKLYESFNNLAKGGATIGGN